ncbi:hypothetical protein DRE_01571 [Drechslerella stenobrocha 248]|uniref:Uncharacterized protein n=1 Tax=Drechslerella stenobrocha 248 TaxID=1043628 RepID=W7HKY9_9PEZI|nr:hypothetical protein DRE_01571 [Drechslerella stenobrocha 248]
MGGDKRGGCCTCCGLFTAISRLFQKPSASGELLLRNPMIINSILSNLPAHDLVINARLAHPMFARIANKSADPLIQWNTWRWAQPTLPPGLSPEDAYNPDSGRPFVYDPPRPTREVSPVFFTVFNKLWQRIVEDIRRAHDELGFQPGREKDYTPLLANGNYSGFDDIVGAPPHDVAWYVEKQLLTDLPYRIGNMQVTRPALTEPIHVRMGCFRCCSRTCTYGMSFDSPEDGLRIRDLATMLVNGLFDWDHGACVQCLWSHNSTHCAVSLEISTVHNQLADGRVWYDYVGGVRVPETETMFCIMSLVAYAENGGKIWGRGGEFQHR